MSEDRTSRRRLLAVLAAGTAGALAGCPAGGDSEESDNTGTPTSEAGDAPPTGGTDASSRGTGTTATPASGTAGRTGDGATPTRTRTADGSTRTPTPEGIGTGAIDLDTGFGAAIALEGDTAVVGHPEGGAAHVFERADGAWSPRAVLSRDEQETRTFGSEVALTAESALVGDPDAPGQSACVATRAEGAWSAPADLNDEFSFSGTVDSDGFGAAIAVADEVALIGSPGGEGFPTGRYGASAYVYERVGEATWLPEATLLAGVSGGGGFGQSVATAGATGFVSAPEAWIEDDRELLGAVHAFQGVGYEAWRRSQTLSTPTTPTATIRPRDAGLGDGFGWSIDAAGDTLVVGAPNRTATGFGDAAGAAYVFERVGESWEQTSVLLGPQGLPSGDAASDGFGFSVAVSGERALVSAPRDRASGADHRGSASLFEREGGAWIERGRLLDGTGERVARLRPDASGAPQVRVPGDEPLRWIGGTVALSGGTALVQAGVTGSEGDTRPVIEVVAIE